MRELDNPDRLDYPPPLMWKGHPGNPIRAQWVEEKDPVMRRLICEEWWRHWREEWVKLEPPGERWKDGGTD